MLFSSVSHAHVVLTTTCLDLSQEVMCALRFAPVGRSCKTHVANFFVKATPSENSRVITGATLTLVKYNYAALVNVQVEVFSPLGALLCVVGCAVPRPSLALSR